MTCNCARENCQYITAPHPLEVDRPPPPPRPVEVDPREALLDDHHGDYVPADAEPEVQQDILCGENLRTEWRTQAPSPPPIDEPSAAATRQPRKRKRTSDVCYRCGAKGHWAEECQADIVRCGNCRELGHRAVDCPKGARCHRCGEIGHFIADCPEPAPCRCCGQLGHSAEACPSKRPVESKERRFVLLGPPPKCAERMPLELHRCHRCDYTTTRLKPHRLLPAHHVQRRDRASHDGHGLPRPVAWCGAGGKRVERSELIKFYRP